MPFSFYYSKVVYFLRPFSLFLGANVNTDPIVVTRDTFDALDAPLAIELAASAVNPQPVECSRYHNGKVKIIVELVADPTSALLHSPQSRERLVCVDTCSPILLPQWSNHCVVVCGMPPDGFIDGRCDCRINWSKFREKRFQDDDI